MKKLLVVLLALTVFGMFAFAQDEAAAPVYPAVKIGGNFIFYGNFDASATVAAGQNQARLKFDTQVDKNNDLYIELRGNDITKWGADGFGNLYNFKLTTDLTGALAMELPVTVKLTTGYFDTYFTNWGYADTTGWAFYYDWPNGLNNAGQSAAGAFQFDVGAGALNFHYYNDLQFNNLLVGADGTFGDLGFWASYGAFGLDADKANLSKGTVSLEASYAINAGDLKAKVYPFVRYSLATKGALNAGASAGVDYTMFHAAVSADLSNKTGTTADAFGLDHFTVEGAVSPMANFKAGVNAFLNMNKATAANALTGIDLYGSYTFGKAKLLAGYVVGGTDKSTIPLNGDTYGAKNGLYASVGLSF
jgi:hypothetical protein